MPTLQNRISASAAMTEAGEGPDDDATSRPDRRLKRHREVLAIACVVCFLAFLLHELPDGRVAVRGFPRFPLPQTCTLRAWLGIRCPGCGLTRSIIHLAEGEWHASWRAHRLGALFAIVILFQVPYRLYALRRPRQPVLSNVWLATFAYALIATLVVNWLWDLAAGRLISQ
jgi:Protein of unknown function (DUF2752)